jgi:rod shape-determining protein MreB
MFLWRTPNAFAIDLGTNNTLVYQPKRGIILEEPTSIAFDKARNFFFGSGSTSHQMIGKYPKAINVMHPLSKGAIANLSVAKAYIKEVIRRISTNGWFKPSIVVSVPSDLNAMERQAVIEAGKEGGAREVLLLKDPFSAALGSSLMIEQPTGILVLDIGAGVSEVSLLSLNGIVMSKSLRIAGNDIDEAIVEYFKTHKRILISLRDAERLKQALGNLVDERVHTMHLHVKNMLTRMPESFEVSSVDVKRAIMPIVDKILSLTHNMLSSLPPVFANDILEQGLLMTGGTCMLGGMDAYLSSKLEMDVHTVENPLQNIILGAGLALEEKRYSCLLGV